MQVEIRWLAGLKSSFSFARSVKGGRQERWGHGICVGLDGEKGTRRRLRVGNSWVVALVGPTIPWAALQGRRAGRKGCGYQEEGLLQTPDVLLRWGGSGGSLETKSLRI